MKKNFYIKYGCALMILWLTACKKEIKPLLPAGTPDAAINFYNASDVLATIPLPVYPFGTGNLKDIFIDTLPNSINPAVLFAYPDFQYQEFPNSNGADIYNNMQYMRLKAGYHRFRFSDTSRVVHVIADTAINMSPLSYTSLYLADAYTNNNDIAAYHLIAVPEERKGTAGRVRVRLINLSPDLGSISCYLQKADGSTLFSPLPQQLPFGSASAYTELDTAGASLGSLTLQIIADKDPSNNLLTTRVAALPGHSYVLVVQGFSQSVTRQVPNGKDANGIMRYSQLTISANLRVTTRETY